LLALKAHLLLAATDPQEALVEKFVERQNIAKFKNLLKTETDPGQRELLQRLLADEEFKLASHRKDNS
jgi:hypothetical protein